MTTPDSAADQALTGQHLQWIAWFFAVVALIYLVLLPIYNYCIDAYGVYRKDYSTLKFEPNLNYVKTRHLLANLDSYDVLAMGSSRVGHIDMQGYFGKRAYSLTFPEALHSEQLQILRLLLSRGLKIKRLILGVDDVSYHISMKQHRAFHRTRVYPDDPWEAFMFHAFYLLRSPTGTDKSLLTTKGYLGYFIYDIDNTGRVLCPTCEERIDADPEAHLKNKEFDIPRASHGPYLEDEVQALKELIDLAAKNDIKLDIFVNPLYEITYLDLDLGQFNRFKKQLAQWHDFYDFSGLNEITTNKMNYSEASHYRPHVGRQILELIDAGGIRQPGAFGAHVTAANVDAQIDALETQWQQRPDVVQRYQAQQAFAEAVAKYGLAGADSIDLSVDNAELLHRCSLGRINGTVGRPAPWRTRVQRNDLDQLSVSGWSVAPEGMQFDPVFYIRATWELTGQHFYFPAMNMTLRRDLEPLLGEGQSLYAGFDLSYDASAMPNGEYILEMFRFIEGQAYVCHISREIRLEGWP